MMGVSLRMTHSCLNMSKRRSSVTVAQLHEFHHVQESTLGSSIDVNAQSDWALWELSYTKQLRAA